MSILVEQQDEIINTIDAQAADVEKDVETGRVVFT
jgi:t-SNARE complex subunit (syntaxin)